MNVRGTLTNSRLGNYFSDRVVALGFLNLGYSPPLFSADFAAISAATKAAVGYEVRSSDTPCCVLTLIIGD